MLSILNLGDLGEYICLNFNFKLMFKYPTGIEVTAYHGLYFTVNINGHTSYHDGKYYETCSDCLLSEDTTLLPDGKSKGRYLFLYSEALCLYSAISSHTFCCGCASFSPTTAISVACSFKARTGLLEPSHFETFKKQAECLEFPPLYHFVSTGESPLRLSVHALTSSVHWQRCRWSDLCPDARQVAAEKTQKDEAGQPAAN